MALIAGIEEAGRGPVVGPLVIAGILIEEEKEEELRKMGARDSKEISPKQRELLCSKIEKTAKDIVIIKVAPCRIDKYGEEKINLNKLEGMKFAEVINHLKPDKAFIDSPDVNLVKFREFIKNMVTTGTEIVLEHKAENKYPVVGAASIVAKVTRDNDIKELQKKKGFRGSGYPSDPETISWLREWLKTNDEFPDFVRKSWATARELKREKKQGRLLDFFAKIKKKPC
jgi:ribonuclease HII